MSTRILPISGELTRLLSIFADGDSLPTPEKPAPAAAVVLVRDAGEGIEVFVTRQSSARGVAERKRWGFPTAKVVPGDGRRLPLDGWGAEKCARVLRMDDSTRALGYFTAAARAALASTGVVLAEDNDGRVVWDNDPHTWESVRPLLHERDVSFGDILDEHELSLRPDLLHPWMRWINTEWQLRRYDTIYFVAALPQGQSVSFRSYNERWGGWMPPAEVIERSDPGQADFISAPSRIQCETLAACTSVGQVMTRVRDMTPIVPDVVRHDGSWWLSVTTQDDPSGKGRMRPVTVIRSDPAEGSTSATLGMHHDEG